MLGGETDVTFNPDSPASSLLEVTTRDLAIHEVTTLETTLIGARCFLPYWHLLLHIPFLLLLGKRLLGLALMMWDMGTDLRLAVDLASNQVDFLTPPPLLDNVTNVTYVNETAVLQFPQPVIDELSMTIGRGLGLQHPVWFILTLSFFYLPHFSRVWSSNMRELLTKFFLHGFQPINRLEKADEDYLVKHLPRFALILIYMDKNKKRFKDATPLGVVFLVLFYIFEYSLKLAIFVIMPILVVLRQFRNICIVWRLEIINVLLGLSPSKGICGWPRLVRAKVNRNEDVTLINNNADTNNNADNNADANTNGDEVTEDNCCPSLDTLKRWIFKRERETATKTNRTAKTGEEVETETQVDWSKLYVSEQSQLLDSLMSLAEERNQETFFEAAPQATLQIYMLLVGGTALNYSRAFAVVSSILALGLASSDYTEHKLKRHFTREEPRPLGTLFILLWKLPTLAARCVALAVFSACLRSGNLISWILLVGIVSHFILSFIMEYHYLDETFKEKLCKSKSPARFWRVFVHLCEMAWISFFSLLEFRSKKHDAAQHAWVDHDDPTSRKLPRHHLRNLILYNVLMCVENAFLLVPWYVSTAKSMDNQEEERDVALVGDPLVRMLILVLILFASPISMLFMLVFQIVCHVESDVLKTPRRLMFRKSSNFYEIRFRLLHHAILHCDLEAFEKALHVVDEEARQTVLQKMQLENGDSLEEAWAKNVVDDVKKIIDDFHIGKILARSRKTEGSKARLRQKVFEKLKLCGHELRRNVMASKRETQSELDSVFIAWRLGETFCFLPDCQVEGCHTELDLKSHHDDSSTSYSACYIFAIMMSYQGTEDPAEHASRFFPLPPLDQGVSAPFKYEAVDWRTLHLDPLLTLQLKIGLNPATMQPPSELSFYKGPALISMDSQKELFLGFVDRITAIQDRTGMTGGASRKRRDLLELLERDNHLVTANDFTLLKHPTTGKSIVEELGPVKYSLHGISLDSLSKHSTTDFARFIGRVITHTGLNLEWLLELSPNFWPVVMRTILTYPQHFEMRKLERDYFRYWIGKMGDLQLEPVKALAPAPEKRKNDFEQSQRRLKSMMGTLEGVINGMREECAPGYKQYKPTAKRIYDLVSGIKRFEDRLKKLDKGGTEAETDNVESVKTDLQARMAMLISQLADYETVNQEAKVMYDHEEHLNQVLVGCLTRFNPRDKSKPKPADSASIASSTDSSQRGASARADNGSIHHSEEYHHGTDAENDSTVNHAGRQEIIVREALEVIEEAEAGDPMPSVQAQDEQQSNGAPHESPSSPPPTGEGYHKDIVPVQSRGSEVDSEDMEILLENSGRHQLLLCCLASENSRLNRNK